MADMRTGASRIESVGREGGYAETLIRDRSMNQRKGTIQTLSHDLRQSMGLRTRKHSVALPLLSGSIKRMALEVEVF